MFVLIVMVMVEDSATSDALLGQSLLTQDLEQLGQACADMGVDRSRALGLAVWGDGVPFNFDRSESLDVFSISIPGLQGKVRNMRIPLFAVPHRNVIRFDTLDDLMDVLRWSFVHLALGRWPMVRHDNSEFHPKEDRLRMGKAGSSAHLHGFLVECRGDWKQLKDCFRFPQHNELAGICWRCTANPQTWRVTGLDAPWREHRLSHWEFIGRLASRGLEASPLFGCPGLRTSCFKPDWLHVCDLGIAADFLGNFLLLVSAKFEGAGHKSRVAAMWLHIRAWYVEHQVENRLDSLDPAMSQSGPRKPPKLRAKAAQARWLVPYAPFAAAELLGDSDVEITAKAMAVELAACYSLLSPENFEHSKLAEHCRRYCALAVAMEGAHNGILWRCKPKLHLFQELCEYHVDCPSLFWTYRDEDYGGSVAQLARRRGGPNKPSIFSKVILERHCARHALPQL